MIVYKHLIQSIIKLEKKVLQLLPSFNICKQEVKASTDVIAFFNEYSCTKCFKYQTK